MNNYLIKNIAILIGSILFSVVIVAVAQYFFLNRANIRHQVERLRQANESFEEKLQPAIETEFQSIIFLTHTSYPKVAIDFDMDQQFFSTLDRLIPKESGMKFALLDAEGNWRSFYRVSEKEQNILRAQKMSPDGTDLWLSKNKFILFRRHFPANGSRLGFLVGILPVPDIERTLIRKYQQSTIEWPSFKPSIGFEWFSDSTNEANTTVYYEWPFVKAAFQMERPEFNMLSALGGNLAAVMAISILLILLFSTLLKSSLKKPVDQLLQIVKFSGSRDDSSFKGPLPRDTYFAEIAKTILKIHGERTQLESLERQREVDRNLRMVAEQVAHDIRSPLMALNMILPRLGQLSDEERTLGQSATRRIKEIASDLFSKTPSRESESTSSEPVEIVNLVALVVGEKRLQQDRRGIRFVFNQTSDELGLFALISGTELQRAVSNIMTNAIEACDPTEGVIQVSVGLDQNNAVISIEDNGCGISSENLARIGERGFSRQEHKRSATDNGAGLGIYHAKNLLERVGGHLLIESSVGKGTKVSLVLPRVPAPTWFIAQLPVEEIAKIIILDDDLTMHQIWRDRLSGLSKEIQIEYLDSPNAFKTNIKKLSQEKAKVLFLIDQEFNGFTETGLDLIREFDLARFSILVTGKAGSAEVRRECTALGLKLVPKEFIPFLQLGSRCEI